MKSDYLLTGFIHQTQPASWIHASQVCCSQFFPVDRLKKDTICSSKIGTNISKQLLNTNYPELTIFKHLFINSQTEITVYIHYDRISNRDSTQSRDMIFYLDNFNKNNGKVGLHTGQFKKGKKYQCMILKILDIKTQNVSNKSSSMLLEYISSTVRAEWNVSLIKLSEAKLMKIRNKSYFFDTVTLFSSRSFPQLSGALSNGSLGNLLNDEI